MAREPELASRQSGHRTGRNAGAADGLPGAGPRRSNGRNPKVWVLGVEATHVPGQEKSTLCD